MATLLSASDLAGSLEDLWRQFRKEQARMQRQRQWTPEGERELFRIKNALVERFGRLRAEVGESEVPAKLQEAIQRLAFFDNLSNLSDTQLAAFEECVEELNREMNSWLLTLRRKAVYENTLVKKKQKRWAWRFLAVPAVFTGLIALLAWLSIHFFFGH